MEKKNILIIFLTAISIIIVYGGILLINYETLVEVVPTHINYKGEVDGYNYKYHLWIATFVNLILVLALKWAINNPHKLNYPVEITEMNKINMHYKMQLFLAYLCVFTSLVFSLMIFNALDFNSKSILYILSSIILPPILFTIIFNKK